MKKQKKKSNQFTLGKSLEEFQNFKISKLNKFNEIFKQKKKKLQENKLSQICLH